MRQYHYTLEEFQNTIQRMDRTIKKNYNTNLTNQEFLVHFKDVITLPPKKNTSNGYYLIYIKNGFASISYDKFFIHTHMIKMASKEEIKLAIKQKEHYEQKLNDLNFFLEKQKLRELFIKEQEKKSGKNETF